MYEVVFDDVGVVVAFQMEVVGRCVVFQDHVNGDAEDVVVVVAILLEVPGSKVEAVDVIGAVVVVMEVLGFVVVNIVVVFQLVPVDVLEIRVVLGSNSLIHSFPSQFMHFNLWNK